jgi:F-type H+-transporting ATPase subunit gamma
VETAEVIKRKLSSAEDLLSIAKTMKAHAASSIRVFEQAAAALSEYYHTVADGLGFYLQMHENLHESLGRTLSVQPGIVLIGTDQGLCGAFNEQLARYFFRHIEESAFKKQLSILVIGHRLASLLSEKGVQPSHVFELPNSPPGLVALVQKLLVIVAAWQESAGVNALLAFHNIRLRSAAFTPQHEQFLPLKDSFLKALRKKPICKPTLPWSSLEPQKLLRALIRQHFFISLQRALAESLQSEHATRLSAMQRAEKNIEEMIAELKTEGNNIRQETITSELLDIIGGYEVLKQA